MSSPYWTTICYFGHFVEDESKVWSWRFSGSPTAVGFPLSIDTSYEELYAAARNICKVDDIEIGFLSPGNPCFQVPVRITSNDHVKWCFNFNKQGYYAPICITILSQEVNNGVGGGAEMEPEENNGVGGGAEMEPEENNGVGGGAEMEPEENNGVGGGAEMEPEENNGVGGGAEMESEENNRVGGGTDQNANGFNTPRRYDFSQENNFTNEHLISSVGSTLRLVPIDFDLKVDQVFNNKRELQEAVHMIALHYNFQFKTKKSNKSVYTVVCVDDNCTWRLRATKYSECDYFQVRKYTADHTCPLNMSTADHRQATSWIIGKHISPRFEDCNTTYRPADIMNDVRRDFGVQLSYQKARRCRESALTQIRGSPEDSYTKLAAYAHNLTLANPGTVYFLERDSENRFKYFFLAYGPCIYGFHHAIRPVVVVDGTFLTERYKGTLIIATCQDGNMQIYPLAWAIVDSENDASWLWFFTKLKVVTGDDDGLVVISDRHKSLISAFGIVFQNARHAHCIYHIKGNLRTVTRKAETISLFKRAAEAYTTDEFRKHMSQIEKTDEKGWKYLSETNFETWARSHFKGDRYNIMTSNNAESLNSVFRKARQTPILALFDSVGKKLQAWFSERREDAQRCGTQLTPAMEEKLRKSGELSKKFTAEPIDAYNYVVRSGTKNFIVNFDVSTCTCRKFQLDHIPCEHVIAAAKQKSFSVYPMCSTFYSTECWRLAYAGTIFPVPNEDEWDIPDNIKEMTILPPLVRPRGGRRRTARIPSTGEFPSRQKCSRCQKVGHNRLSCRDQTPMSDRQSHI